MKDQVTIIGASMFNGVVEGVPYDNTKVVIMLPVPKKNADTAAGFNINVVPYGDHKNFAQFKEKKFPLTAIVDFELTNKGMEINEVTFPPANQQQKPVTV